MPLTVLAGGAVLVGVGLFGRASVRANADTVLYHDRFAGGFAAVGLSERLPGFICLSRVERDAVSLDVRVVGNVLYGDRTHVSLETRAQQWSSWLHQPLVLLVDERGGVKAAPVSWSHADFVALERAMDCSDPRGLTNASPASGSTGSATTDTHGAPQDRRAESALCGRPFLNMAALLEAWPAERVPHGVRAFVEPGRD